MTVYNILSSLEPEQEEQAFHSPWGRGDERKTAAGGPAQTLLSVSGFPPYLPSPCGLQTLPTLCEAPSSLPAVHILVTGVDEDTGVL